MLADKGIGPVALSSRKHTINSNPSFDFLLDVVSRIPDPVQGQADTAEPRSVEAGPSRRKASTANHGSASTATPASAQTQGQAGSSSSSRGRKRKTAPTSGGQGDEDAFIPPPTYPYNLSPQTQNIPHPTGAHTAAPPAWAGGGSRIKEESGRERARDEDYDEDNAGAPVMDHQPMRPGIGNLLNPSEDEVERKPMTGSVSPGGGGTGARPDSGPGPTEGPAQLANSGAAQVPESGRGMFDDYDDDDDY